MEVKTVDELLALRNSLKASQNKKTTFTFECQRCHKKVERRIFAKSIDLLCKGCLAKKTNLEKFGVENPSQAKEIKEKKKQTSLKHFGTENPMQSKEVVETLKKSNLEKFGVDNAAKLDSVKEKMKATNKEKYGEEFFAKTDEYKITCKKSWEKKSKEELKEIDEKRKATCKEIYGDENFNNRDKFKKTCCSRFGHSNPMKKEEFREYFSKMRGFPHSYLYEFNGEKFDSSWELALWIYAKDHNEEIEREPLCFEYEFNEKVHRYFPDFKYKGKLIEIKGDYLFQKMMIENTKNHAKFLLMKSLGVNILREKEISPYLNYVENTYGKDYLKSFRQR